MVYRKALPILKSQTTTEQKNPFIDYKALSACCINFSSCVGLDTKEIDGNLVDPFTDQVETTRNRLRPLGICQELGLGVINSFFQKPDRRQLTWHHTWEGRSAQLHL